MTTVAYKDGVMACDSCWTHSGSITVKATKINRLPKGALLGQAGDNDARIFFKLLDVTVAEQLPSYSDLRGLEQDFDGILVLPNREVYIVSTSCREQLKDEDVGVWQVPDGIAAIGSGMDAALAILRYGGSPYDAVKIACTIDINSRPPIHQVPLKEPPKAVAPLLSPPKPA